MYLQDSISFDINDRLKQQTQSIQLHLPNGEVQDRKFLQLLETISLYLYNYVCLIKDSPISCRCILRPKLFLHVLSVSIFWRIIQDYWSFVTEFCLGMSVLFINKLIAKDYIWASLSISAHAEIECNLVYLGPDGKHRHSWESSSIIRRL